MKLTKNQTIILLGSRVRQLRKERGWTQAQLAERIDKTTEMICHLENGSASTKLKTLDKLANVFDVKVPDLLKEPSEIDISKLLPAHLKLFNELIEADTETVELITKLIHALRS